MASILRFTGIQMGNSVMDVTGSAPSTPIRGWANFTATVTPPPSINASGNVNSITLHSAGDYTINFTTALPSANYAWGLNGQQPQGSSATGVIGRDPGQGAATASSMRILSVNAGSGRSYPLITAVFIF